MTYHQPQDYVDRYVVPFRDVTDADWRIVIADPNYTGDPVTLTGAASPIEWMGKGDESQDDVILGSTGSMRLVCMSETEKSTIYTSGALLPVDINDRRVQVQRSVGTDLWAIVWQGYIQPQIFTQDYDVAPLEIELPIVSTVASLEYFPMPEPGTTAFEDFQEQTNIGGLIRTVFCWCGTRISTILTNKPIYEDFQGGQQLIPISTWPETLTLPAHWTQGGVSASYFYTASKGSLTAKTFADVLETICYPYGKLQDYGLNVGIMMSWKDDASNDAWLYGLPVWSDYWNREKSSNVRFNEFEPVRMLNLYDLNTESTDNTYSIVQKPKSMSFKSDAQSNTSIFSLNESLINSKAPLGRTMANKKYNSAIPRSGLRRFVIALPTDAVDKSFASSFECTNSRIEELAQYPFCRVVEASQEDSDSDVEYKVATPIAFNFPSHSFPQSPYDMQDRIIFRLSNGVRSCESLNHIKMSIRCCYISEADPINGYYEISSGNLQMTATMFVSVVDLTTGKYLYVSESGTQSWQSTGARIPLERLPMDGSDCILRFNEERAADDNTLHSLRIGLYVDYAFGAPRDTDYYGRMYAVLNMEYEEFRSTATYNDLVALEFAKNIGQIGYNGQTLGGNGVDLDIIFKTICGRVDFITDGDIQLPYNSFCDSQTYIDTADREKIEMNAISYEEYRQGNYFDLLNSHVVILDGSKVYIPIAVGMEPAMRSVRLRLISTNVQSAT